MKPLQDATFKQIRDFIYEKSGIYITDSKKYLLENRLPKRLQARKLTSYEDYLYLLLYGNSSDELGKLFDTVTTNETYFFRELPQLELFAGHLAPAIGQRAGGRIAIWSAACSTGEEPYSLSMLLTEKGFAGRQDILASDLSGEVIESAKRGVYNSYSIRNVPPQYLAKYFRPCLEQHELAATVRQRVTFSSINLTDERQVRAISGMDVIFCRNVLIYFDEKAKAKVVSLLFNALRPGGYLFVGMSESLHNITRAFKPVALNNTIVYQKA